MVSAVSDFGGRKITYRTTMCRVLQGGAIKTVHIYDDVGRRSVYQNVRLFIRSKNDIFNVATFK